MKYFLLTRKDKVYWDETEAFVVRAENEEQARELAFSFGFQGDNSPHVWLDSDFSECKDLTDSEVAEVIMQDFKAS